MQIFNKPVYLSDLKIDFAKGIALGKKISQEEVDLILDTQKIKVYFDDEDENIELSSISILEDEEIERIIESKKKNKKSKEIKLEEFKKEYGKVFCEICKEEDIVVLEIHYEDNIDEINEVELEKLKIVCANCHKKLHGHKIKFDELMKKY